LNRRDRQGWFFQKLGKENNIILPKSTPQYLRYLWMRSVSAITHKWVTCRHICNYPGHRRNPKKVILYVCGLEVFRLCRLTAYMIVLQAHIVFGFAPLFLEHVPLARNKLQVIRLSSFHMISDAPIQHSWLDSRPTSTYLNHAVIIQL